MIFSASFPTHFSAMGATRVNGGAAEALSSHLVGRILFFDVTYLRFTWSRWFFFWDS